jgi:hypothetical protein
MLIEARSDQGVDARTTLIYEGRESVALEGPAVHAMSDPVWTWRLSTTTEASSGVREALAICGRCGMIARSSASVSGTTTTAAPCAAGCKPEVLDVKAVER